jgi:hypothetical protein
MTLNKKIIVLKNSNSMVIARRTLTNISNFNLNQELQNTYERKLGFGEYHLVGGQTFHKFVIEPLCKIFPLCPWPTCKKNLKLKYCKP